MVWLGIPWRPKRNRAHTFDSSTLFCCGSRGQVTDDFVIPIYHCMANILSNWFVASEKKMKKNCVLHLDFDILPFYCYYIWIEVSYCTVNNAYIYQENDGQMTNALKSARYLSVPLSTECTQKNAFRASISAQSTQTKKKLNKLRENLCTFLLHIAHNNHSFSTFAFIKFYRPAKRPKVSPHCCIACINSQCDGTKSVFSRCIFCTTS